MALRVGDAAPPFDVTSAGGARVRLEHFRDKKIVVLYFYPKDETAVCTAEACGFRDQYEDLRSRDVEVIGVSIDDDASHRKFAEKHKLPFQLLSDPDRALARAYGAAGGVVGLFGRTNRITYVIDKQGKIAGVFDSALFASKHTDGVRATVEKLARHSEL